MQVNSQENLRITDSFRTKKERLRYWQLLIVCTVLGILLAVGLLVYNNPVPVDSPSFLPVVKRRVVAVVAMSIAVVCQSLSTVTFQTMTNNRIITPSLLGFDALYSAIHTGTMFLFGVGAFLEFKGMGAFLLQVILMIAMSLMLYGWLVSGKNGDLQLMLLVGVILGTGLRSLSTFMRRVLSPSEFDILQARMFGSVNNAESEYFGIAIPIVIVIATLLFMTSRNLNVLSLGQHVCQTFGVSFQKHVLINLVFVSILMAISTALVGPLTFFGFLVATLTYQLTPTYDHRYLLPMSLALGFVMMTGAYFFMYHIFNAQGVVSVIIEMFGGITFLLVILRKGKL